MLGLARNDWDVARLVDIGDRNRLTKHVDDHGAVLDAIDASRDFLAD
jgi:hypothetical protein